MMWTEISLVVLLAVTMVTNSAVLGDGGLQGPHGDSGKALCPATELKMTEAPEYHGKRNSSSIHCEMRQEPLIERHFDNIEENPITRRSTRARLSEFPFMVKLYTGSGYVCGGIIVSSLGMLTAAQCIYRETTWTVYMGTTYPNFHYYSQLVFVSRLAVVHPSYDDRRLLNNIGVLFFNRRITFNSFIKPVAIFRGTFDYSLHGKEGIMVGWGGYSPATYCENELQFTKVEVFDWQECNRYYANGVVHYNDLCVFRPYYGSLCPGDAGSPVLMPIGHLQYAVALSSFTGNVNCGANVPSVFTPINKYWNWIGPTVYWPYK